MSVNTHTHNTQHLPHFFFFFFFADDLIIHLAWIFNRAKLFLIFGFHVSAREIRKFGKSLCRTMATRLFHALILGLVLRDAFFFFFSIFSPLEVVTTTERPIDHYSRRFYFPTALKKKRKKKRKKKLRLVMKNEWNSRQADDGRDTGMCAVHPTTAGRHFSFRPSQVPPPVVWFSGHLFHDPFFFFLSKQHLVSNPITCAHGTHTLHFSVKNKSNIQVCG